MLELDELRSLDADDRESHLCDYFYDHINPSLANRLVNDVSDFDKAEFQFSIGDEDGLIRLTELAIRSDPYIWNKGGTIYFLSASDEDDAEIDDDNTCGISRRVADLCLAALRANNPVGYDREYNDGAKGRASGCSTNRQSIKIDVEPCTGHQHLAAAEDILPAFRAAGLGDDENVLRHLVGNK